VTSLARIAFAALALAAASPVMAKPSDPPALTAEAMRDEVIYHIFVRSFRDGNGDGIGDLKGMTDKLGYLKALGVTSLMLTPLQPSPYYHNYFATDFEGIDPAYGTMNDYFAFVRAAKAHGLKVYLDQEIQYVAEGHPWLSESRGKPGSRFSRHILYDRPKTNEEPQPFLKQPAWPGYDGKWIGISMVDMRTPAVKRYFEKLFLHWIDPHGDGSLRDGVDGFRIDHMMDDLDHKNRLTNLFADFWTPIFRAVKARNPAARILAEQADWGYGDDWLTRGNADLVFAFPLRGALTKLDKRETLKALRTMDAKTPAAKGQILFLENHDTDRFMSEVRDEPHKARIGAAMTLLLRGTPLVYYGQELGMRGRVDETARSDAAHIPLREAFRWDSDLAASGSAIWYKGERPSWLNRYNRSDDGVSLQEQHERPDSLYVYYRKLLALRAARPELRQGSQRILCDDASPALCLLRELGDARTLILANTGADATRLALPALGGGWRDLLDGNEVADPAALTLAPYEVRILGTR
jgi:glycosidase